MADGRGRKRAGAEAVNLHQKRYLYLLQQLTCVKSFLSEFLVFLNLDYKHIRKTLNKSIKLFKIIHAVISYVYLYLTINVSIYFSGPAVEAFEAAEQEVYRYRRNNRPMPAS